MLAAVTWVAGGLRAYGTAVPALKPTATVDQKRFSIKVVGARTGLMDTGFGPRKNLLVIRMYVTNMGDTTIGTGSFQQGIFASSRPGGRQNEVEDFKVLSNGGLETYLHPRLPAQVDLIWPLPNGTKLPQVTVSVRKWEYVEDPFGGSDPYWALRKDEPLIATVSVPVRQGATA